MGAAFVDRRGVAAGVGLSLVLAWLLTVPFCPLQVAAAFPEGCATFFIGAFMFGCAAGCVASIVFEARRCPPHPLVALLLPLGMGALALALALEVPYAGAWVCACSFIAGLGEAVALLAWGRLIALRSTVGQLEILGIACAGAALLTVAIGALSLSPGALWGLMVALAVAAAGATVASGGRWPSRADSDVVSRAAVAGTFARLWEPVLGLGLSLMSAVLPWGSFIAGSSASVPAYWSFALGALLAGAAAVCVVRLFAGKADFEVASHIAIPLLAAAVVALRMVGDVEDAGRVVAAAKGVASGVASAGFLVCAWLAMGREAHASAVVGLPFALGLGAACLVAFAILPAHAANQAAASLAAPFLSLAFLVVACCSSIVHLRRHSGAQQTAQTPPGIEEAADALAHRYALTPRETEVLHHLVLGRSAEGIGAVLGISPNTVRSHVGNIHGKLDISSRDQLADLIEQTRRTLAEEGCAEAPSDPKEAR